MFQHPSTICDVDGIIVFPLRVHGIVSSITTNFHSPVTHSQTAHIPLYELTIPAAFDSFCSIILTMYLNYEETIFNALTIF